MTTAVADVEQARAADAGMKAMIPIGRPFLDYVLSALADAGISDVCLVIGPEHDAIRRYYAEEVRPVPCSGALRRAAGAAWDGRCRALGAGVHRQRGPFLVLNADNYYPVAAYRALANAGAPSLPGFDRAALVRLGNVDAERIRKYALLRVGDDGVLQDIVEKPDEATFAAMGPHALVSMNLWAFTHEIFAACERVEPSARGEFRSRTRCGSRSGSWGCASASSRWRSPVLDLSSRGDIASVASALSALKVRL